MKQVNYIKRTPSGTIFDIVNVSLLVALSFLLLYPFWNQLIISLNDGLDAQRGGLYFWPRVFTLGNCEYIFKTAGMLRALGWSVLRVIVGTSTKLFATGMLAYITTVSYFSFHRQLRKMFLITMYISGGMIPIYLWMIKLHLIETFTVYWLPSLLGAYEMMIIASYIASLPDAMFESARMDGAKEFKIYLNIVLPLCVPVFAALGVMVAVGHWNSWFDIMIYNPSGNYDTLQMELRNILIQSDKVKKLMQDATVGSDAVKSAAARITSQSMRAATMMIVTIPIVAVYPFFQKYFVKGISIGAVKG
ncbi:MAG TPA: carbohydrate ABC transporter permease [Candidatus Limiplasma sp.]|nr:carbohydrate ABC transporter permease [Candidatus Limiplasma sp.]